MTGVVLRCICWAVIRSEHYTLLRSGDALGSEIVGVSQGDRMARLWYDEVDHVTHLITVTSCLQR